MKKSIKIILGILFITIGLAFGYKTYHNLTFNELLINSLNGVKGASGKTVSLQEIQQENTPEITHEKWTELLQKYVSAEGAVDYKGFQSDSLALNNYLDVLSQHPPGNNWTKEEQLAYWINVYNAFTIKLITNYYPVKSIRDIGGSVPFVNSVWDINFFEIGGVPMELNNVEHEIIRKEFNEPRIHFALNCASISCPKLLNEAYTAEQLEQQLQAQTLSFLNNPIKNRIDANQLKLSNIFDWYQGDFTKNKSLHEFLQQYIPEVNASTHIEYLEYDWGLNEN